MGHKKDLTPNEFTTFVRDSGIRAFDHLAGRFGSEPGSDSPTPIQKLGNLWTGMEQPDKERFFEQLITAAQTVAISVPVMVGLSKARKARKKHAAEAELAVVNGPEPDEPEPLKKKDKKQNKKDKDKKKKDKNGKKKKEKKKASVSEI